MDKGKKQSKTDQETENKETKGKSGYSFKKFLMSGRVQWMLRTMILKNVLYYEQAVAQILTTSSYKVLFRGFATKFDLSITTVVSGGDDDKLLWCFVDGLNAKWKILLDLLIPIMVFGLIFIAFIISKLSRRSLVCCKKRVNFIRAFITMYLVIIGSVLDVLFKLMSCQKVGDIDVHYYFGYETCYQSSWWLACISLSIIIISFTLILIKLVMMGGTGRQNRDHPLNRFVGRYKPQYYYWEYVIFIRRILIALFAVSVQDISGKFAFLAILTLFVYLQHIYNPFVIHQCNKLEYTLLACLVLIATTNTSDLYDNTFINIVVSSLIILPFPLLIYEIYSLYKSQFVDNSKKLDDYIKDHELAASDSSPVGLDTVISQSASSLETTKYQSDDGDVDIRYKTDDPVDIEMGDMKTRSNNDQDTTANGEEDEVSDDGVP